MFRLDKTQSFIEADESAIQELYQTSTALKLGLPGYDSQQCRGYLCVARDDDATLIHAALYLLDTRQALVYVPAQQPEERADQARVVQEGTAFLASFGFTLEKVNLSFSKALREVVLRDTRVIRPADPVRKASRKKAAKTQQTPENASSDQVSSSLQHVVRTSEPHTVLPIGSPQTPTTSPQQQSPLENQQPLTSGDGDQAIIHKMEVVDQDTQPLDEAEAAKAEQERLAAEKSKAARMLAERAARMLAGRSGLGTAPPASPKQQSPHADSEKARLVREAAEQAQQKRMTAEQAASGRRFAEQAVEERLVQVTSAAEQERLASEKQRYEQLLAEKDEAERLAREKAHAEQAERERLTAEKDEMERLLAETAEAERQAREKASAEHAELQRLAAERIAAIKAEAEQQSRERLRVEEEEQQRRAAEKAEMERLLAERAEAERTARHKAALEQAEKEQLAAEKAEMERLLAERAETERLAQERAAAEQAERERILRERLATEKADSERIAREQAAREQAKREQLAAEKAEIERLLREKELAELEAQKHASTAQAELERLVAEKADMKALLEEKILSERCGWEQAAIEQEERKKLTAEMKEAERLLAEKSEAERLAREQAAREQSEKERLLAEIERQSLAEQEERKRLAAERAELERLLAETREAERLAREKSAEIETEKLRLEEEIAAQRPPGPNDFRKWKEEKAFAFAPAATFAPAPGSDSAVFGTDPFAAKEGDGALDGSGDDPFGFMGRGDAFAGFGTSHVAAVIFSYDRSRTGIEYRAPEDIMDIYYCANMTRLAPEGYPIQGCIGFICSLFRNEQMTVEIGLFLTESNRSLIYRPDWQPDSPAGYAQVVQDAIGFLETVGYIVDPVPLSEDPAARQKELDKIPVLKKQITF